MRERRFRALADQWPKLRQRARSMRAAPTRAEALLWEALRDSRFLGLKFRRQHPVGPYVVDFLCAHQGVVVEVDGEVHERTAVEDAVRQRELEAMGLRLFRCTNAEVLGDLPAVLRRLASSLDAS